MDELIVYLVIFAIFMLGSLIKKIGEAMSGESTERPLNRQDARRYLQEMRGSQTTKSSGSLYRPPTSRPPSRPAMAPRSTSTSSSPYTARRPSRPSLASSNIPSAQPVASKLADAYAIKASKPTEDAYAIKASKPTEDAYAIKASKPAAPASVKQAAAMASRKKAGKKKRLDIAVPKDSRVTQVRKSEPTILNLPKRLTEIQKAIVYSQIFGPPKSLEFMEE